MELRREPRITDRVLTKSSNIFWCPKSYPTSPGSFPEIERTSCLLKETEASQSGCEHVKEFGLSNTTHQSDEIGTRPVSIAIVGAGIRGLGVLERIVANAIHRNIQHSVKLHIVDPEPANPAQYAPDQ